MSTTRAPPVLWAQRKDCVFLKIRVEDCKSPIVKLDSDKVYFKGKSADEDKSEYEITIELFEAIDGGKSKFVVRDRATEIYLKKEKEGPYWPRLTKQNQKFHWLKVDFNKWQAEDESDSEAGGDDGSNPFRNLADLTGSPNKPDFGDFDNSETDSDDEDEDIPDLQETAPSN